ncbi:MAG: RNase P subunit p30 family protein [archaeon]
MFFDALVHSKECVENAPKFGYTRAFFEESILLSDLKKVQGKINFFQPKNIDESKKAVTLNVDVLLDPFDEKGTFLNNEILTGMRRKEICLGISFLKFLTKIPIERAKLLEAGRKVVFDALKKEVNILFVSNAFNVLQMRSPREMICFGMLFGLEYSQAKWAISECPRWLIERK